MSNILDIKEETFDAALKLVDKFVDLYNTEWDGSKILEDERYDDNRIAPIVLFMLAFIKCASKIPDYMAAWGLFNKVMLFIINKDKEQFSSISSLIEGINGLAENHKDCEPEQCKAECH